MTNTQTLKEIIHNSDDWESLENQLLFRGIITERINNKRLFVEQISECWYKLNSSTFFNLDMINQIEFNDKIINIFGMIHDTPTFTLSNKLKSDVRKYLFDKVVICEDGFCYWLNKSYSFNEQNNKYLKKGTVINNFLHFQESTLDKAKNINTVEEFMLIKQELFKTYLPEPLGLNAYKYILNEDENNFKKTNSLMIKKYVYEYEFILDFLNKTSCKELYVLVGCRHEKPLEYFLKRGIIQ